MDNEWTESVNPMREYAIGCWLLLFQWSSESGLGLSRVWASGLGSAACWQSWVLIRWDIGAAERNREDGFTLPGYVWRPGSLQVDTLL